MADATRWLTGLSSAKRIRPDPARLGAGEADASTPDSGAMAAVLGVAAASDAAVTGDRSSPDMDLALSRGTLNQKVLARPRSFSTPICPPINSTNWCDMARPSPAAP